MKNLLIYMINFLFFTVLYANIEVYYVKNVVTIQNGKNFNYIIDFKVKTYKSKSNKFSDVDICTGCKKPIKLVKAPLDKWVVVLDYRIDDNHSKELKNKILEELKENFEMIPIKKDSNNGLILSYYEIKKLKKEVIQKVEGVKILQSENTYSQKIIIPPNDNFTLLKSMGVDKDGKYFKSNEIKLTSSCGKLKIKDSSRFSFTFFENEKICSIYAKLGKYIDIVEVIKLNKDGSMPSSFNILYKNNNVDTIDIDYYTFKTKGIILKSNQEENSVKWINKDNNLRLQIIKDGLMIYPKKKYKKYEIELLDIKKGLSDKIIIQMKNE